MEEQLQRPFSPSLAVCGESIQSQIQILAIQAGIGRKSTQDFTKKIHYFRKSIKFCCLFNDFFFVVCSINTGLENGEIMTSGFHKPSKGKYAHGESGPDGQCGEHGAGMGLVEGHAYSVLRSGEVDGHKLICFRNPWAKREALIKTKRFHSRAFCCKQSC